MFEKPLGLRENPFLAGHNPKYLFPSREHQEALAHLRYGIQNREPFVLITGEVGTGKTTAVYDALAEWGSRAVVALITNSALTRSELLEEICLRFGLSIAPPLSKPHALVELQRQLTEIRGRGELAILLVDEAQNLDRELLEEIRLLSNLEVSGEYLLQIFLVGQPELEAKLAQKELRQLRQRIGIHYRILPLSTGETARYVRHRVSVAGGNAEELFPSATCAELFRVTNGIPRELNVVAGQSLLNAFVEDSRTVTVDHVRAVEREIEFQSVLRYQGGAVEAPVAPAPAAEPARPHPAPAAPTVSEAPPPPAPAAAADTPLREALDRFVSRIERRPLPENDLDVEDTETAHSDAGPVEDDALVDEYAAYDAPPPVDDEVDDVEAPAPTGTDDPTHEPILPSWIDAIVTHRQTAEERPGGRSGSPIHSSAAPPAAPRLTVLESERPGASHSSAAMFAAPPPERVAPSPAPPIPLFDRRGETTEHLPSRLRDKLTDEDEPEAPRGRSLAWPIASIVIAAVAITILLLVRFGPWSSARPVAQPAATPAPPTVADTSLQSDLAFPPFGEVGGAGGGSYSRTVPVGPLTNAPSPAREPARTHAPPTAAAGGTLVPAGGVAADPNGVAAPSAPGGPSAFGIAIGTYLNEARAIAERVRIGESAKLESRVLTVSEDTVSMYRVVVGSFTDRVSAERAASDLVQRGLVLEARVVALAQAAPTRP